MEQVDNYEVRINKMCLILGTKRMNNQKNTATYLQKYLPMVLRDEAHFKSFCEYLLIKYDFKVDEVYLRRKLYSSWKNSFRDDSLNLAQRLVRGKYTREGKEKWIWLGSVEIASITYEIICFSKI